MSPSGWNEWRRRVTYQWFGPSTLHLQYEAYLLLSLLLLTLSSFQGLYRTSWSDPNLSAVATYFLLTTAWLSRHLLLRWFCTWDPSTQASPTLRGWLSRVINSHMTSGQTFNAAALCYANSHWFFPSSLLYLLQWIKLCVGYPLLDAWCLLFRRSSYQRRYWRSSSYDDFDAVYYSSNVSSGRRRYKGDHQQQSSKFWSSPMQWIQRNVHALGRSMVNLWRRYGPTWQFLLPAVLMAWYLFPLYKRLLYTYCYYVWTPSPYDDTITTHPLSLTPHDPPLNAMTLTPPKQPQRKANAEAVNAVSHVAAPYGRFHSYDVPDAWHVFQCVALAGTVLCLYKFCRLTWPLPDLVAGQNVLRDLKQQSRGQQSSSSTTAATSGSTITLSAEDYAAAAWPERVHPIATEHRVRLTLTVFVCRVLENLVVCGILPRTSMACRATGYCPDGIQVWQLHKVLYPVGITKALRKDGVYGTSFAYLQSHPMSALWTFLGVAVVSSVLLLAQSVSWNKAYLAIQGYVCAGEWTLVEGEEAWSLRSVATSWDARRKYRKGDAILYPPLASTSSSSSSGGRHQKLLLSRHLVHNVYRATSNSPEGPPYGRYLQRAHEVLRKELGHAETSTLLLEASTVQLAFLAVNVALWLLYLLTRTPAPGLLTAIVANVVAAHAVLNVGRTNHKELQQLNAEVNGGVKTKKEAIVVDDKGDKS